MIIGINQNLAIMGREFHVQTEVIEGGKELVRTTVYVAGRIIGQRETELPPDKRQEDELREFMRAHHDVIVGNMVRRMEEMAAAKAAPPEEAAPVAAATPPQPAGPVILPSRDDPRLQSSLQVRRLLTPFWRIADPTPPADDELSGMLAYLADLVATIVDSPVFLSLRVEEQVRFNELLDRLRFWLETATDHLAGITVWSQVVMFAYHISKVNNRKELVAYDSQLAAWAVATIQAEGVTPEMLEQLDHLHGRDIELDRMLAEPQGVGKAQWLERLQSILASL